MTLKNHYFVVSIYPSLRKLESIVKCVSDNLGIYSNFVVEIIAIQACLKVMIGLCSILNLMRV